MLLLLLNYVVLRAVWKIDVHLISTLVNNKKSLYYCMAKITKEANQRTESVILESNLQMTLKWYEHTIIQLYKIT